MTDKEKAWAYDGALNRAKAAIDNAADKDLVKGIVTTIFPSLRESEDERIRKSLVDYFGRYNPKDKWNDEFSFKDVLSYLEKQKEQNGEDEECTDFTIYHPLKNGKGEYECIPYSFYGSLTSFSEDKDLIDFLRTCFYTEEECNEWIEQQKEQKPVDNEEAEITDFERSVYDLCPVLGIEEAKATASDLLELAKKTLLKTGKVVLASNYPEGCSFEDGFHLGYNEGFNAKKKEQNPTNSEKSKEWSEEDRNITEELYEYFRYLQLTSDKEFSPSLSIDEILDWLKSLRPSWKPSEEQMEALLWCTAHLGGADHRVLAELYEHLKMYCL